MRSRGSDGRSILSALLSLSLSATFRTGPAREKTRVVFERRMNCKSFETRGNVDAILPSLFLSAIIFISPSDINGNYFNRLNRLFISIRLYVSYVKSFVFLSSIYTDVCIIRESKFSTFRKFLLFLFFFT